MNTAIKFNEIIFWTSNPGKISEARACLSPCGIQINAREFDFVEIQSDSQENVLRHKLSQVKKDTAEVHLVDDTGLYLYAFKSFPGVMSKFVYYSIGYEGLFRLLPEGIDRRAEYRALLGLSMDGKDYIFEGRVTGKIAPHPDGNFVPGRLFEPIFIPEGANQTLAAMADDERARFSYRGRAFAQLIEFIKKRGEE